MKRLIVVIICSFVCTAAVAETINEPNFEQNLFSISNQALIFESEVQLENFIKSNKPSTFKYYDRLDQQAKKQVFKKHLDNQDKDITEIVLQVYRTNR